MTLTIQDESPLTPVVGERASAPSEFPETRRDGDGDRDAVFLKARNIRVAVHAGKEERNSKHGQSRNNECENSL